MSCSSPGATHHLACDCREAEFAALRAEVERLRQALREFEWRYEDGYRMCPKCYQIQGTSHLDDCPLGLALAPEVPHE